MVSFIAQVAHETLKRRPLSKELISETEDVWRCPDCGRSIPAKEALYRLYGPVVCQLG